MVRAVVVMAVCASLALAAGAWAGQPGPQSPRIQMPPQGAPTPPRDTSARPRVEAPAVGTARLHGRVVSADTGEPLRRATVTAQPTRPPEVRRGGAFVPPRTLAARTDDQGRFTIADVPAGDYMLTARRPGYADRRYGQVRPSSPSRPVTVADGATVGPLDFTLQRGGVITGRVMDEEGEPAERVQVRVVRQQRLGAQVRYVPTNMGDTTDDLGQYRLYGLPPGEYLVVAEPSDRGRFFMGSGAVQGTDTDTIPTYAPGTASASEAQKVQVLAGAETPMDIQLVAARVATVSGVVVMSSGEPMQGGFVRLQPDGADMMGMGRGGAILGDGRFEVASVPPGSYTLVVQPMMRNGPDRASAADTEGAILPIAVNGEDSSVTVRTSPGSTIRGRVVLEGAEPSALGNRELRVMAMPTGQFAMIGMGMAGRGLVQPDMTFELVGVRGEQALGVMVLPENWWIKDVRVAGQSAVDGYDFGSGRSVTGVEIVVSGRPTGLSGTVSGPSGEHAGDYAIVIFPADEEKWERVGPGLMGARAVRPGLDGAFKLTGLRPGSYYALAVPADQADTAALGDPEHLRVLAGRARTVEVEDGTIRPITLPLVDAPGQ